MSLAIKNSLSMSVHHGCQTAVYLAVDDKVANESGEYYAHFTKFANEKYAVINYIANHACDDEAAQRLWDLSCKLVKLEDKYNIPPPDDLPIQTTNRYSDSSKYRVNPVG